MQVAERLDNRFGDRNPAQLDRIGIGIAPLKIELVEDIEIAFNVSIVDIEKCGDRGSADFV